MYWYEVTYIMMPSPVEGKPIKTLSGKQLMGFELTTSRTVVESFNSSAADHYLCACATSRKHLMSAVK